MKILLQNIQMGIGMTEGYFQYPLLFWAYYLPHSQKKLTKLADYLKKGEIDVALLTEVDDRSFRVGGLSQLKTISDASGLKHFQFFSTHKFFNFKNQGNGIISNSPILGSKMVQLPKNSKISFLGEKRYLCQVKIKTAEKELTLCVTHLSLSPSERRKQLIAVNEIVKHLQGTVVLAGDFNVLNPKELEAITSLKRISNYKTFPSWKPRLALDNLFVSADVKKFKIETVVERFSDHLGLVLEI